METNESIKLMLLVFIFISVAFTTFYEKEFTNKECKSIYEYKVLGPSDASFETVMNSQGQDGWLIVGSRRAIAYTASYERNGVYFPPEPTDIANYEVILMKEIKRC